MHHDRLKPYHGQLVLDWLSPDKLDSEPPPPVLSEEAARGVDLEMDVPDKGSPTPKTDQANGSQDNSLEAEAEIVELNTCPPEESTRPRRKPRRPAWLNDFDTECD